MRPIQPRPDHEVLEAGIVDRLAANTASEPVTPAVAARIKHRLMERIAQTESGHLTVPAAADTWQPFNKGVEIKVLHEDGGVMSYLLRLAPGAAIDAHRHGIDEECVVLEGTVQIGESLVVHAGGFHMAHRDTLHARITTVDGATLFLRGEVPTPASLV
jgi:anti-sigma factor ChrR (cupin superfamily)